METLEFIYNKFNIDPATINLKKLPILINPFDRTQLALMFNELGFKTGVEVGVEKGRYACIICGSIPGVTLYGVDPWATYDGYIDYTDQNLMNSNYQNTLDRMKDFPNFKIIRDFSVEAARKFKDESLDFVYLDGNHLLLPVIEDLTVWMPKLRVGGIMSGHDFVPRWKSQQGCIQVIEAVMAYTSVNDICPWFVLPGGNTRVHRHASFFWVKK